MMMKIALITDTHYGARGDSSQFSKFFAKFYNNVFFPYIDEHNIKAVIHLGDVFDRRKYINFLSLKECKEFFFDPLCSRNLDTYIIAGNHDTFYKNTNEVNSVNLLLGEYQNILTFYKPWVGNFDGTEIMLMPWICSGNYKDCMEAMDNTSAQVLFGHFEINGFEMYKGSFIDSGFDANIFSKFDVVCSGHFHHKSSKGNIHYLGTPYEITWSDFNDQKGFHVFDTDTRELTFIPNPYNIFHKIHYDDLDKKMEDVLNIDFAQYKDSIVKVIIRNKSNPYWFDLFIERLEAAGVIDMQVVDDHLNLNLEDDSDIINEAEDTITILNKYVEQLDLKADKQKLETLLRDLYSEALNLEIS
jgi:DNA repair exonuclease SbcCD nuclease subunit